MKQKAVPVWFLLWFLLPAGLLVQTGNQAGIVVIHEDGLIQTACVTFSEESISGSELLNRSGLNIERDVSGLGELVCRIEETGCPATDCFCQCQGGEECVYWSYWHQTAEGWQYSPAGSGMYQVNNGAIDGWVWGAGNSGSAPEPPPITLAEICQPVQAEASATLETPTLPPATVLAQAKQTATTAAVSGTITPTANTDSATPSSSYLVFGGVVVGLLAIFLLTRKNQAQ